MRPVAHLPPEPGFLHGHVGDIALLRVRLNEARTGECLALRRILRELNLSGSEQTFTNSWQGAFCLSQPADDEVKLVIGVSPRNREAFPFRFTHQGRMRPEQFGRADSD